MEPSSSAAVHPALHLRTVQLLLWEAISPKIREVERDEVELVLGSLVEENAALFEEADMLGGILQDLEGDIDGAWSKRKLIDTPARSMLERDLRKMMNALKFTMGAAAAAASMSSKEKKVMDYLQATAGSETTSSGSMQQRPYTPRSRPASSCSTSSRPSTGGSTGSFTGFALPDVYRVLQQVESKLNVFDIDAIAPTLKQALRAEHEALLEDIEYLQQCLQEKGDEREANLRPPPPITDLKDFGRTLQGMERLGQAEARILDAAGGTGHEFREAEVLRIGHSPAVPQDAVPPLAPATALEPIDLGAGRAGLPPPRPPLGRVPRAPPSKPSLGKPPPASSRARRLRGIVNDSRRQQEQGS